ncbi:MAG: hypothetical protein Hyperionvirus41_8 [Hyperionvirus sp.]|uniref:Uncharacterized protein n=1 Tax=Hyperionvirus sp. TaxID=2487770 RepID=A0A3G5AEW4_9VIRU|nr:MAG: hypothetical protein Hyperionvirus41_8 [Hyperionvirus sp.]
MKITDLNGNTLINNDTPIIIINKKNFTNYLTKLAHGVWKYNLDKFAALLKENNLNPKNFLPVGHLKTNNISKALMVNKKIAEVPDDYNFVRNYGQSGTLWVPRSDSGIKPLIYSPSKDKPNDMIGFINHRLIQNSIFGLLTDLNNFQSYTVQGELKTTITDDEGELKQEFHAFDGNFVSNEFFGSGDTDVKYKGKHVVLVESDDPWYLNKKITTPAKYIPVEQDILPAQPDETAAKFTSPIQPDLSKENLGAGYSFADHYKQLCNFTDCSLDDHKEMFNPPQSILKSPLAWLIILLIILIIIKISK